MKTRAEVALGAAAELEGARRHQCVRRLCESSIARGGCGNGGGGEEGAEMELSEALMMSSDENPRELVRSLEAALERARAAGVGRDALSLGSEALARAADTAAAEAAAAEAALTAEAVALGGAGGGGGGGGVARRCTDPGTGGTPRVIGPNVQRFALTPPPSLFELNKGNEVAKMHALRLLEKVIKKGRVISPTSSEGKVEDEEGDDGVVVVERYDEIKKAMDAARSAGVDEEDLEEAERELKRLDEVVKVKEEEAKAASAAEAAVRDVIKAEAAERNRSEAESELRRRCVLGY